MLWASELGYRVVLDGPLANVDPRTNVSDHLGSHDAHAWHVGRNDRAEYDGRNVGKFLSDLELAQPAICVATLTAWLASFEEYLKVTLKRPGGKDKRSWGPYISKLARHGAYKPELHPDFESVLRVDMWRAVRNRHVHEPRTSLGQDYATRADLIETVVE